MADLLRAARGMPGEDIVAQGLKDLRRGAVTENSLLLLIAAPRLHGLGFEIQDLPAAPRPREHALYSLLEQTRGRDAYSHFNSPLRRLASLCHALERRRRPPHQHPFGSDG